MTGCVSRFHTLQIREKKTPPIIDSPLPLTLHPTHHRTIASKAKEQAVMYARNETRQPKENRE